MKVKKKKIKYFTFTIFPNELAEAILKTKMSSTQIKICVYLLRNTYGWHRATVAVSLAELADACDSTPQWISVQIQDLIKRKIIIRSKNKTGAKSVYKINIHIADWVKEDLRAIKKSAKKSAVHKQPSCANIIPDSEPPLEQPKKPKVPKKSFTEDSLYYTLAKLLLEKILNHLPEFKQPDLQQWAKTMQQIIEKDGRNTETLRQVINFSQKDPFWQTIILDAASLRNKFDHLNAKRLAESSKRSSGKYDEYEIFSI